MNFGALKDLIASLNETFEAAKKDFENAGMGGSEFGQQAPHAKMELLRPIIAKLTEIAGPDDMVPASGLRNLYRAYVSMLESARDRILFLGGDCDPTEAMEWNDPALIAARKCLAVAEPAAKLAEEMSMDFTDAAPAAQTAGLAKDAEQFSAGYKSGYEHAMKDSEKWAAASAVLWTRPSAINEAISLRESGRRLVVFTCNTPLPCEPDYIPLFTAPAVVVDEAMKRRAAEAIANARAGRRGAPGITNVLDILPPKLLAEVMEDATDALAAALIQGKANG